jgi:hypothetical protein
MEAGNNRIAAPGIEHSKYQCGADEYRGHQAALIAAGIAKPEWFPNGEKPWCASRTIRLEGGTRIVMRKNPSGAFVVIHYLPARNHLEALRFARRREAARLAVGGKDYAFERFMKQAMGSGS